MNASSHALGLLPASPQVAGTARERVGSRVAREAARPLTIGIVALQHGHGYAGAERYVRNLIQALIESRGADRRYRIFLPDDDTTDFRNAPPHVSVTRIPGSSRLSRTFFQHIILPLLLRECDWTLFTGHAGSLLYPRSRSAVCVYDLVSPNRFDLVDRASRTRRRRFAPRFLRKTRAVICPNAKVRDDVVTLTKRTEGVVVTRLPLDPAFSRPAEQLDKDVRSEIPNSDFVLVVGFDEPKKNLALMGTVARMLPDRVFVLAGLGTASLACKVGLKNVIGLGFVDQETMVALYHQCKVVLCPSPTEGYGHVVAEAISVGKPVVCFNSASPDEFTHPLVHAVNDRTADAMAGAILRLPQPPPLPRPSRLTAFRRGRSMLRRL